jgi:hypothetical protein
MAQLLIEPASKRSQRKLDQRVSPIVWLNLVCLDAPIVAVTWQWLFARSFHVPLVFSTRAALFLTAWLIYLADRFADARMLRADDSRSLRQEFCRRHQSIWIIATIVIAVVDLWIILRQLDDTTVRIGLLLGTFSLVYLAVNYWLGKIWRIIPAKEICVGSLFAFGTVAALLPRIDFSAQFARAFLLFAALCSMNCISIAIWERDLDRSQRKNSIATCLSKIQSWFRLGAIAIAAVAIVMAFTTKMFAQLYCCVGVSAFLLAGLDRLGERIPRDERTALADLVLLTPLILFSLGTV